MVRPHTFVSGLDYVRLNWTRPKFPPEQYQFSFVCTRNPTCAPIQDMDNSILGNMQFLSSDTTFVRISGLGPSSSCTLFLLAVYNPASIDSGISITGMTLHEDTRKRNPCLGDYVINLNYCFCLIYMYMYDSQCGAFANINKIIVD